MNQQDTNGIDPQVTPIAVTDADLQQLAQVNPLAMQQLQTIILARVNEEQRRELDELRAKVTVVEG